MKDKVCIAIHGGAGTMPEEIMDDNLKRLYKVRLKESLQAGLKILQEGGSSLNAVEASVTALEDCPLFNAGKGSVFTNNGIHEMDASIMDGKSLKAGAAACLKTVKNPVQLARAIMERSNYVFLAGPGADSFAIEHGLDTRSSDYFFTAQRYEEWQRKLYETGIQQQMKLGTVGAVALDKFGNLAAAASTGGLVNKRQGRVGDSAIIGAGTYADNGCCAVSCTGDGELFIRSVVAYDIACLIKYRQYTLKRACEFVMNQSIINQPGSGGLIAIDSSGNIEMPFNSNGMYRACCYTDGTVKVKIYKED